MNDRSIIGSLQRAARVAPGKTLLQFVDGPSYTADDLQDGAARAAGMLAGAGVGRGDRVALMVPNRIEFLWTFFGTAQLGAVSAPLNTSLRGPILDHMLGQTEPKVIVIAAEYEEQILESMDRLGSDAQLLVLDHTDTCSDRGVDFAREYAAADPVAPCDVSPYDLASILYTSGTTGPSKGVMHTHGSLMAFSDKGAWLVEMEPTDIALSCLPLFHANALCSTMFPALRCGATTVFSERFSASRYWNDVRELGATSINLLGAMVPILWNAPRTEEDARNDVRVAVAVPTPPAEFYDAFEQRFGLRLVSLFGMTDTSVIIGTPNGQPGRPGYCGKEHPDFECRIVDHNDEAVPDGQPGELVVRPRKPNSMMQGYYRDPEATLCAMRNLWFHSGDVLVRESDGWFRFVDRQKDALRRFGENISSFEVETVVLMHPEVAEAAVFAVPSDLSEDEVMVAVVLEDGVTDFDRDAFGAHCDRHLPYFAVPRYVDVRDALPKTSNEKVRKDVLRNDGVTASTWDRGPRGRKASQAAKAKQRTDVPAAHGSMAH